MGRQLLLLTVAFTAAACAARGAAIRDPWYEERPADITERCKRDSAPVDFAEVKSRKRAEALKRLVSNQLVSLSVAEAMALAGERVDLPTGKRVNWSSPRLVRALRPKYEAGSPWVLMCEGILLVGFQGIEDQLEMQRTAIVVELAQEPRRISVTVDCCAVK